LSFSLRINGQLDIPGKKIKRRSTASILKTKIEVKSEPNERTLSSVQTCSPFEQSWASKRATSPWFEGDIGTKKKRK